MSDYALLKFNVDLTLQALQEHPQPDTENALENMFGSLFAKAIEQEINESVSVSSHKTGSTTYSPGDVFAGVLYSSFDERIHMELEK